MPLQMNIMDCSTGKVTVRDMTPEEEAEHLNQPPSDAKRRAVFDEAVAKLIAADPDLAAKLAEAGK